MRRIIVLSGRANSGKTTTFHRLNQLLSERGFQSERDYPVPNPIPMPSLEWKPSDFRNLVRTEKLLVGLNSAGDNPWVMEVLINLLLDLQPDILFVTTRTRGATVQLIQQIARDRRCELVWIAKTATAFNSTREAHNIANQNDAQRLIEQL